MNTEYKTEIAVIARHRVIAVIGRSMEAYFGSVKPSWIGR